MKDKTSKADKQPSNNKVADSLQFQLSLESSKTIPTLGTALQAMLPRERDQQPLDQLRGILGSPAAVQLQGQVALLKDANSALEKELESLRKQAAVQRKSVPLPRKLKR